jgi:hypothetical protein
VSGDGSDLTIETLALSEAELLEHLASLETDMAVYRELAVAGFDAVRDLTIRNDKLRADRDRLRDENSALREHLLLKAGADVAAA